MGGGWQDGSDGACAGATLGCALYGNEYGHCDAIGQYCHGLAIVKPKIHDTLHELNIDALAAALKVLLKKHNIDAELDELAAKIKELKADGRLLEKSN